jgi:ABC-type sugar transport system ATPase subunit
MVATSSGLAIELLGRQIPVAPRHHAALQGRGVVEVGIRPQAMRLMEPGPDRITGRVFLREPLGLEDEVLVETGSGSRVKVVTPAGEAFPEGARVGIAIAPPDVYVFETTSKATLCCGIG